MLLLGICNPAGEGATYNGLYYKQDELASMVADGRLHDVPVKQEHSGGDVGHVVSSFVRSDGALQCVMEVDDTTVEGSIAVRFADLRLALHALIAAAFIASDYEHTRTGRLCSRWHRRRPLARILRGRAPFRRARQRAAAVAGRRKEGAGDQSRLPRRAPRLPCARLPGERATDGVHGAGAGAGGRVRVASV